MTLAEMYIDNIKPEYVKKMFDDLTLYDHASEKRDLAKIEKLLNIKSLVGFWDKVRQFTKKVTSDHAIHAWQCLAELRYIQLDLQQNYNRETLTKNKGVEK